MASHVAKQGAACNKRARDRGLVGTLSTRDWQRAIEHFQNRCAYCQQTIGWTIDRFQPLSEGGTTYSKVVVACSLCNAAKASTPANQRDSPLVSSERLTPIRDHLEAIGKRNQDWYQTLCEREPIFARMDAAVKRLKGYCEQRAFDDPIENAPYRYVRRMIFGIEWDPARYYHVASSLMWHQMYSQFLGNAVEDARRVLTEH